MPASLEGVADLTAKFNEIGVKFTAKNLKVTVREALEIAEHLARARMPTGVDAHYTHRGRLVSPGYALSTLHIETSINKRSGAAVAKLGVGREAFYAVQFVELGTAHMPAQPWLRPSFESSQEPMLQQIATSMKKSLETTAKSRMRAIQRARLAGR